MTKNNKQPTTNVIQNKPNLHLTAENAEHAEKKSISVSDCSVERYALYPISPCSLRTRRLMENKANQSQFSNRKTDDRSLSAISVPGQKAEYIPRFSVIRPRHSVRVSWPGKAAHRNKFPVMGR
jgi:hypothetical protein